MNEDMNKIFASLDALLIDTDISDVTADSQIYSELPEGYYLCEVDKAQIKESKTTKTPMVAFQFSVCEDGVNIDSNGKLVQIKKSAGRKLFKNYVMKDSDSVRRFVTDMLKFEGDTPGEPILAKEYFVNSEVLEDALDILIGTRLYLQVTINENAQKEKSSWINCISWKRAKNLGLPE